MIEDVIHQINSLILGLGVKKKFACLFVWFGFGLVLVLELSSTDSFLSGVLCHTI